MAKTKLNRYGQETQQISFWLRMEAVEALRRLAMERGMPQRVILEQALLSALGRHNHIRNEMSKTENFRQRYDETALPSKPKTCSRHPWWPLEHQCVDSDCAKKHCPHCAHDDPSKVVHWEASDPRNIIDVANKLGEWGFEELRTKALRVAEKLQERLMELRTAEAEKLHTRMQAKPHGALPAVSHAGIQLTQETAE